MTRRRFCAADPQILGVTAKNLVATATWRSEFVHPWVKGKLVSIYAMSPKANYFRNAAITLIDEHLYNATASPKQFQHKRDGHYLL